MKHTIYILLMAMIISCKSTQEPKNKSYGKTSGEICRYQYGESKYPGVKKYFMIRFRDGKRNACYDMHIMKDENNTTDFYYLPYDQCTPTCKEDFQGYNNVKGGIW